MRNLMKRAAGKFAALLLVQFLLIMTTAIYAAPGQAMCGPDCNCGCATGGECTCNPQQTDYQYANYYQDSGYYYQDNSSCDCCCGPRYTRPTCINSYGLMYECCCDGGVWLPDDPPLFRPFMADPRQICESAGWRFDDNALTKNVIDVSYADSLPIYRWCNVGPWGGQLQIELEGCLSISM